MTVPEPDSKISAIVRACRVITRMNRARPDVRQSEISRIENGRGNPTVLTLARLADALGLEVSLRLPSDG